MDSRKKRHPIGARYREMYSDLSLQGDSGRTNWEIGLILKSQMPMNM
ncbi:MAG TPA: hypothetical protein PL169_27835 [Leptospiraceae bacterium]|nr:hypothetical protein [Leptospiraceae bacterium]